METSITSLSLQKLCEVIFAKMQKAVYDTVGSTSTRYFSKTKFTFLLFGASDNTSIARYRKLLQGKLQLTDGNLEKIAYAAQSPWLNDCLNSDIVCHKDAIRIAARNSLIPLMHSSFGEAVDCTAYTVEQLIAFLIIHNTRASTPLSSQSTCRDPYCIGRELEFAALNEKNAC